MQFSPVSVTANSATTNVELELNMPGNAANERPRGPFGRGALPVALGLVLLPFTGRIRKLRSRLSRLMRMAIVLVAGAVLVVGMTDCGGGKLAPQFLFFHRYGGFGVSFSLRHGATHGEIVPRGCTGATIAAHAQLCTDTAFSAPTLHETFVCCPCSRHVLMSIAYKTLAFVARPQNSAAATMLRAVSLKTLQRMIR